MLRLMKRRATTLGLPPGTLVHIGEQVLDQPRITMYDYDNSNLDEEEIDLIVDSVPFKERPQTVTWIDIEGIHNTVVLEQIGLHYNIHPLVLETMLNTDQRPKLEETDDDISIIVKMLHYDDDQGRINVEQVSIILGTNYVLTLQEGKQGDVFDPIRARLREKIGRVRDSGSDYLTFALLDVIVDNYFLTLEKLGDRIEALEDRTVSEPGAEVLQEIRSLKQELIRLRHIVWPMREAISALDRSESDLIQPTTHPYLRSIYGHMIQVMDVTESYREILAVTLDIYLSSVNNRMTSIMNVLTIIMSVFVPLTFIAGVYGMNFKYMPELNWRWGYAATWGVMITVGMIMLLYFRRKRWL